MHELKNSFDVLMARMDDLLVLLEAGNSTSAEFLVPRLREQAAKTGAILDETIQDFSLVGNVTDEFMPMDPEFPDEDEDEDEDGENIETEEVTIGEADSEEEEDGEEDGEEETDDDDEGDSDDNS